MIGIPNAPYLILSKNLYENFNQGELEYVLLHEVGHYVLAHGIQEAIVFFMLFIVGCLILRKFSRKTVLLIILMNFIFGISLIQFGRLHEYQADHYVVSKIQNPEGMILATRKFQNFYGVHFTYSGSNPFIRLFYRSVPYEDRIKIAEGKRFLLASMSFLRWR